MKRVLTTEEAVDRLIEKVGTKIVMATPLGVGKPNHFLNCLYKRVKENPELNLTLLTALSLQVPKGKSELERRFLGPMTDRVFGDYPVLQYDLDNQNSCIPENIKIIEFYFQAGKYKNVGLAQRNYLSSNYTHVARDVVDYGLNVICQQVVAGEIDGQEVFSLSCNPDLTLDISELSQKKGQPLVKIAQTNVDLPFMYGESVVGEKFFDIVIDSRDEDFPVFAPPKMSVTPADHMIGLHASTLVKDDGEIQIGIGSLGDALVHSLCLRQKNNIEYREALSRLGVTEDRFPIIKKSGSLDVFKTGLFAATEMLVDSFSELYKEGLLKKKVYDSVVLQSLLNQKKITEQFDDNILDILLKEKAISSQLTESDFNFLKDFGVLVKNAQWKDGNIVCEGVSYKADLSKQENITEIKSNILGKELRNGAIAHGGFFLGPRSFYDFLKQLPVAERKLFRMKRISQINQLYGHEQMDRLQRINGRFINTCMKVSLNGAACSDALDDGSQISGVGGQYNFVAMAHELPDARSILQLRSTRVDSQGRLESNIVFHYANSTIPRHLRDVVITEYGVADLRGRTDEEVAIELIQVADSRFQSTLIEQAQEAHKLSKSFKLNDAHINNLPLKYLKPLQSLQSQGHFATFPFGTDFTEEELKLGKALKGLKALQKKKLSLLIFIVKSFFGMKPTPEEERLLSRMGLKNTKGFKEALYGKIVLGALRR